MKLFSPVNIIGLGTFAARLLLPTSAAPLDPVTPRPGLLTIIVFYQAEHCAKTPPYWMLSTGVESWDALLKVKNCQAIIPAWGNITSIMPGYLSEACTVTAYTDTACTENAVTPAFEECATTAKGPWKSFAIRGCAEVADRAGE
ncbi:hypothetical protein B0T25DRAFT_541204 [Lasiosphaeria hispida]|uniref:Uncharacterized protein n=1 Tax=Lasiosphaeria hispida TaxID=260671 RepID=A0AAJ0MH66_9PEZI|nr:hypothetical protein B0T25DRAFT_541204 [Lasiosphaeria hispida]